MGGFVVVRLPVLFFGFHGFNDKIINTSCQTAEYVALLPIDLLPIDLY